MKLIQTLFMWSWLVLLTALFSDVLAIDIESEAMVHAAAHVGVSYALTDAVSSVCKKLDGSRVTCSVVGATVALAAGGAKELLDRKRGADNKNTARSMTQNLLGVGLGLVMVNVAW